MKYTYGDIVSTALAYATNSDADEDMAKTICVAIKMTTAENGCNAQSCPFYTRCDYPNESGSLKWLRSEVSCG